MECPNCGAKLDSSMLCCPYCGSENENYIRPQKEVNITRLNPILSEKKKTAPTLKKPRISIGILILLFIFCWPAAIIYLIVCLFR